MTTHASPEMSAICDLMIANNHYCRHGLRELVDSYNMPALSLALDCVFDEGTFDTIIKFFLANLDYYPEALLQNTGMDIYTYPSELVLNTSRTKELRRYFIQST
jgi:hypothetical protein